MKKSEIGTEMAKIACTTYANYFAHHMSGISVTSADLYLAQIQELGFKIDIDEAYIHVIKCCRHLDIDRYVDALYLWRSAFLDINNRRFDSVTAYMKG